MEVIAKLKLGYHFFGPPGTWREENMHDAVDMTETVKRIHC